MLELSRRLPDGTTERDNLAAVAKQTGDWSALDLPPLPEAIAPLWAIFQSVSAGRPQGMGPGAIAQTEYAAWQSNYGVALTAWELDTLQCLDDVALRMISKIQQGAKNG